ncbi:MAG TPA: hypothetical protein VMB81_32905 [Candidatus Sulfotelmatobacter sp.]|nr:hypothetical protein [Candidatus Sulfotelmatobacter sp.]
MTDYIWIQGENGATMMARQPAPDPNGLFGKDGPKFKDLVDSINPLQQLPIIGSIYRELTGDTISQGARLIGGTIYGMGVIGAIGAAANNAIEDTTGHDAGGTAIAMIKGDSLHDMQVAQAKKNTASEQLAYYSGGADPIDPTSLPAGAKMVDYPAATDASTQKQYAALPPDQSATAAADTPGATPGAPAAAPTNAVTVMPLPPTIGGSKSPLIGPTAGLSASPLSAPAAGPTGGTGSGGAIPAMPATPAGLTGLSAISHLPSAGMITPVGPAMTAAAATENLQAAATTPAAGSPATLGAAALAGSPAAAASLATGGTAAPRASDSAAAIGRPGDGFFPIPARTNNMVPRMPVAITQANVGPQPLALTTSERATLPTMTVTPPAAIKASATAPAAGATAAPAAAPSAAATMPPNVNTTGLAPSQIVPPAQIPDAMMRALDKYDALMKSRRSGDQVDHSL